MLVTSKVWNAALGQMVTVTTNMNVKMKSAVASYSNLANVAKHAGDGRVTLDTKHLYVCNGTTWLCQGHIELDDEMLNVLIQEIS